jgi:hypothetical protein
MFFMAFSLFLRFVLIKVFHSAVVRCHTGQKVPQSELKLINNFQNQSGRVGYIATFWQSPRPTRYGIKGAFIQSQSGGGHSWDFGTDRSYLLEVLVAGLSFLPFMCFRLFAICVFPIERRVLVSGTAVAHFIGKYR